MELKRQRLGDRFDPNFHIAVWRRGSASTIMRVILSRSIRWRTVKLGPLDKFYVESGHHKTDRYHDFLFRKVTSWANQITATFIAG